MAFTAVSLQIFWQKFYRNVPRVVLYRTYLFCCNLLICLVPMATKRQNLRKKCLKINSSEAVWGIKLKLFRIVSNNSLYKKIVLLPLLKHFSCYGILNFPLTNSGKSENWAAPSEFGTYRLCEQRRFRRACASAQSRQNLRCSLIQAVSQEEPSDGKPDPWPLWMAGHAQLKFVMTECSKTQIRLARLNWDLFL